MALTPRLMFTTLPNGVADGGTTARLSVLVSFRLESTDSTPLTLEDFIDARNWPNLPLTFTVNFRVDGDVIDYPAADPTPKDFALWQALFPWATPVKPYTFIDESTRGIQSYRSGASENVLRRLYARTALASPRELPQLADLVRPDSFGRVATIDPVTGVDVEADLLRRLVPSAGREPASLDDARAELLRVRAMYAAAPGQGTIRPRSFFKPPKLDFNEMLAMLTEFPEILRRIGVIHDLEIGGLDPDRMAAGGVVDVEPLLDSPASTITLPRTKFVYSTTEFAPLSSGDIVHGQLNLADTNKFTVVTLDTDGGALKTLDFANNIARLAVEGGTEGATPPPAAPPAQRTAGIAVARAGRPAVVKARFSRQKALQTGLQSAGVLELTYEDVVRGYTFDIFDATANKWYSLVARNGAYTFIRPEPDVTVTHLDEGSVGAALTEKLDGSSPDFFTTDLLGPRWTGWSLVVPKPGKRLGPDDVPIDDDVVADTDLKLAARFTVPAKSLPRLRFGRTYRVRMRAKDLAGNSLALNAPAPIATPPFVYRRFEPVQPPIMLLLSPARLGESLERVVIRKPANRSTATPESRRHLAPPRVAEDMAEWHGKFDTDAGRLAKAAYTLIGEHEDGFVGGKPDPANRNTPYFPAGNLVFHYLPDPLARGISVKVGKAAPVTLAYPKATSWPDLGAAKLALAASSKGITVKADVQAQLIRVGLPAGTIVDALISSYIDTSTSPGEPGDLHLLGMWDWIESEARGDRAAVRALTTARRLAGAGQFWPLTPQRRITLVHAVSKPLKSSKPPANLVEPRGAGDISWRLRGSLQVDGHSTGKVTLDANWDEYIDVPGTKSWSKKASRARLAQEDIPYKEKNVDFDARQVLDTKHRRIAYTATYTSRFGEYYPPGTDLTSTSKPLIVDIPNVRRPDAPKVLYAVPTFGWNRQFKGKTQRWSTREGRGLRVYLDRPWFSSGEGELLGVVMWSAKLGAPGIPEPVKPYVSAWGRDPTRDGAATTSFPQQKDFELRAKQFDGIPVSLAEMSDPVRVAGHEVAFDATRKLWYCDIVIRQEAIATYWPFVRLALVRFQPHSIAGMHLSPVVLTEFLQVAPDRTATVTLHAGTFDIALQGIRYRSADSNTADSLVEVEVESRKADVGDPLLGWQPVPNSRRSLKLLTIGKEETLWKVDGAPRPKGPGLTSHRAVLREYELFKTDAPDAGTKRRLVYVETLPL